MFFKQIIFKTTWELLKRTLSDFSMLSPRPDDDISPQAEVSRYFIWQRQHRPKLLPKEHLRSEPRQNLNCQHYDDEDKEADMEFVTSDTSGTCVEYFWAGVKFSTVNAKNHPICEICRIQARVFTKQLE